MITVINKVYYHYYNDNISYLLNYYNNDRDDINKQIILLNIRKKLLTNTKYNKYLINETTQIINVLKNTNKAFYNTLTTDIINKTTKGGMFNLKHICNLNKKIKKNYISFKKLQLVVYNRILYYFKQLKIQIDIQTLFNIQDIKLTHNETMIYQNIKTKYMQLQKYLDSIQNILNNDYVQNINKNINKNIQ